MNELPKWAKQINEDCNGSLRHVKFVYFLLRHYFSYRDRFVAFEAMLMERMIRNEKEPD